MSQSGSGKSDPELEGVELLFNQKGGSASFGTKMVLPLNGVDPGCMNQITVIITVYLKENGNKKNTGSTCRAKCSDILHYTLIYNSQQQHSGRTVISSS